MDVDILDDQDALADADIGNLLPAAATAGAQVRQGWALAAEANLASLSKPRALVICAVGGSAQAGDFLTAVVGFETSVPLHVVRGAALPGWVGPLDVVCVVSCSGRTQETLRATYEAIRRGCQVVGVGSPNSPLAEAVLSGSGGCYVPVHPQSRPPRMMLWALTTPLLAVVNALGLASITEALINDTADCLDELALRCGPASSWAVNPAKELAVQLDGCLPLVWGAGEAGRAVGRRFVGQLAENAKRPAVYAALPEAGHGQIMVLDGAYGSDAPVQDVRLILVRDGNEPPYISALAKGAAQLAQQRGVQVSNLCGEGAHPLLRLASLSALTDFASLYAALAAGVDPQPIRAIDELKDFVAVEQAQ